jgi:elongation factor Ts
MAITASMVKELREKTGAGMMDCKKALTETEGDLDAAVTFLREKGLAAAAKKAGRIAAEGLVGAFVGEGTGALAEVNCETDFVAKNDDFIGFVNNVAQHTAKTDAADLDVLLASKLDGDKSVQDVVNEKIATIGENISVRRFTRRTGGDAYGVYLHGGGSIGVLVELSVANDKGSDPSVAQLAKDLAMHVASESPLAVTRDEVPPETVAAERSIFKQQALDQGKPENIVEKIVDGRINKFFAESVLLEQAFVKDPDITIKKLIAKVGGELDSAIEVKGFDRLKVGEGIEKKSDNLAEEVAKMTS